MLEPLSLGSAAAFPCHVLPPVLPLTFPAREGAKSFCIALSEVYFLFSCYHSRLEIR